jgi:hypothetical protein
MEEEMIVDALPEQEIDLLPAGKYTLGVEEVEKKVSEKSGNAYIKVKYKVTVGEHKGRVVFDNVSFSPKAIWMLKRWLVSLGQAKMELPIEKGTDGEVVIDEEGCFTTIMYAVKGSELVAQLVETEENKEKGWKARNDVIDYSPIDSTTTGYMPQWIARVDCAKEVLDELIEHLEKENNPTHLYVPPNEFESFHSPEGGNPMQPLDADLDDEAKQAQKELL